MDRKACWYSIIRYSPNEISGEIINVGLILHSIQTDNILKFYILDDSSPKIRSILGTKVDETTYKSFKDFFEFYLKESPRSIDGSVGGLCISSPHNSEYLMEMYEFFKNKKMSISEPTFSLSNNTQGLFDSLFVAYIGEKYFPHASGKEQNVKSLVRKIFEDKEFLNSKVMQDISIEPLPNLPLKINVDFGFKNGVWNYLQTTPNMKNTTKSTEWFAKTKFLIDTLDSDQIGSKVYLLYRKSVLHEKTETLNLINYFGHTNEKVVGLDLDDERNVVGLCDKIENEAHNLSEVC